jgi:molecular chaperone HscB
MAIAVSDGDAQALHRISQHARDRLVRLEAQVAHLFEDDRWFSDFPIDIARRLSRARYYDNIVADADRAGASAAS